MKARLTTFAIIASLMLGLSLTSAYAKPPSIHQEFKFMSDFLKALNGAGVKCKYTQSKGVWFVREEGECVWKGQSLTLDLWTSHESATQLTKDISQFGAYYFFEKNWTITTTDGETAKALSRLIKSKVN